MNEEFEPNIVGFLFNWCSHAGADLAGAAKLEVPASLSVIRVMCSGRVDPVLVSTALLQGADGVLIAGCHPGDCHYQKGNLNARRRLTGLVPFVGSIGIGQDRLRLEWISASEGAKIAETVKSFTQTIKELGPSPLNRRQHEH